MLKYQNTRFRLYWVTGPKVCYVQTLLPSLTLRLRSLILKIFTLNTLNLMLKFVKRCIF